MRLALELGMDLRREFDDLGAVGAGDVHGWLVRSFGSLLGRFALLEGAHFPLIRIKNVKSGMCSLAGGVAEIVGDHLVSDLEDVSTPLLARPSTDPGLVDLKDFRAERTTDGDQLCRDCGNRAFVSFGLRCGDGETGNPEDYQGKGVTKQFVFHM